MAPRDEDMDDMEAPGSPPDAPAVLEITDVDATVARSEMEMEFLESLVKKFPNLIADLNI